jgi:hypothetical protein
MSKNQRVSVENVRSRSPASALRRQGPTIQSGVKPKGKDGAFATDAGVKALYKIFKGKK